MTAIPATAMPESTAIPAAAPMSAEALQDAKTAEMERTYASRLPSAEMGKVVTRFPPEASGYLHVGHAKAAMVNCFYARYFHGKVIIRFDDTNPVKERQEFEDAILDDLKSIDFFPSSDNGGETQSTCKESTYTVEGPSWTSDYFDQLLVMAAEFIRNEKAYCDDTPVEQMRAERFAGEESVARGLSVEEHLRRWEEMQKGSDEGRKMCLRAKMNMKDKNKAMRDPVLYRVNVETPHLRHGFKYKCYPTYDFSCPLVDSWQGVTHSLRTSEYADRIPQYYWVQEAAGVRPTIVYEYSRLNFTNTVLSKRKLQFLVDTQVVDGWSDPRFPTIRGLRRRGLQTSAMHKFLMEQGPSKNANMMEWDKLWSINQKVLDPISKRFMAVSADAQPLTFVEGTFETGDLDRSRPLHPKNEALGSVPLCLTRTFLIEKEDAETSVPGEEVTLMRVGNIIFNSADEAGKAGGDGADGASRVVPNFSGDVKKTKRKLHWVPTSSERFGATVKCVLREYDHIITKRKPEEGDEIADIVNRESMFETELIAEPEVRSLVVNDIIQFERRGYVRLDEIRADGVRVFIAIPSGKSKAMSTLSTKVDAATLAKGGDTKAAKEKKAKAKAQARAGAPATGGESASKQTDVVPS